MPEVNHVFAVALKGLNAVVTNVTTNQIARVIAGCVYAVMLDANTVQVTRAYGGSEVYDVRTGALKRKL
jgi:hypothetical protein